MRSSIDGLKERARTFGALPPPTTRRAIREAAGATQLDLARALGVPLPTLRLWERGITRPRAPHAVAYLRLLRELAGALVPGSTG